VLTLAGSAVVSVVDARWLMVLTAVLLAWSGVVAIGKGAPFRFGSRGCGRDAHRGRRTGGRLDDRVGVPVPGGYRVYSWLSGRSPASWPASWVWVAAW